MICCKILQIPSESLVNDKLFMESETEFLIYFKSRASRNCPQSTSKPLLRATLNARGTRVMPGNEEIMLKIEEMGRSPGRVSRGVVSFRITLAAVLTMRGLSYSGFSDKLWDRTRHKSRFLNHFSIYHNDVAEQCVSFSSVFDSKSLDSIPKLFSSQYVIETKL